MKKLLSIILAFILCFSFFSGCTYTPSSLPDIPPPEDNQDEEYLGGDEQEFDNAYDAFVFGQEYFKNAPFYETLQYGTATAMSIGTYVLTKRYKSDVTNNFLYETTTIGTKMMGIDPTFTLKSYKENDSDTIYYSRFNSNYNESTNPNGAQIDPQYSTSNFKAGKAVFNGAQISEKSNWTKYKQDVMGNIPENLTVYIINESTIKNVLSFEENKNGFKYVFKLSLNEGAVADYKHQVELASGQKYAEFNRLNLEDGLTLEFYMDKFGRIQRVDTEENYKVDTGGASATVVNISTEYISYNKRPKIEIMDADGKFTGPTITAAPLPGDEDGKVEQYNVVFNSQGGSACDNLTTYYNTEVGELPQPTRDGYVFEGWYTSANGEGTKYNERTLFLSREDLTLYAYWYLIDPDGEGTYALISNGTEYMVVQGAANVSGEFTLPEEYNGKPVTAIGENAYRANTNITKLIVHNKITSIGNGAFYNCNNITQIEFEQDSTLVSIGDNAFYQLSKLTGLMLPSSVTTIGSRAFFLCSNISFDSLVIPKNITTMGAQAFYGCTGLKEIVFEPGSKLTALEDAVFRGCNNAALTTISIPAGTTHIGKEAFFQTKIQQVIFQGGNVLTIGEGAFSQTALTSIEIPASVTQIDEKAFSSCSNLTSVLFDGGSLEVIGNSVFQSNSKLTSVRIPASVTKIGDSAFSGCSSLTSITFAPGSKLTTIGKDTFKSTKLASFKVPSSVVTIGEAAFTGLTTLTKLEFEYGSVLQTIENNAFYNTRITVLNLPASLVSIGDSAFQPSTSNTALTEVNFGQGSKLEKIGSKAFFNCKGLTSFTFPSTVTDIGGAVIANTSITQLTVEEGKLIFEDGILYLPDYKAVVLTLPDQVSATLTELDPRVTEIMDYAFYNCTNLTEMTLHNGITKMGEYAFRDCTNITSFKLSNQLTEISNYALCGTKITTLEIPESITRIGQHSLRNTKLTSITIPSSVTVIDTSAFQGCTDLATVSLSQNLTSLGSGSAFNGCTSLTSIELPATITNIPSATFGGCTRLTSITLNRWEPDSASNKVTTLANTSVIPATIVNVYVPLDSVSTYQATANWSNANFVNKIQAIPTH